MWKSVFYFETFAYTFYLALTLKTYYGLNFSQSNVNGKAFLYSCKSNEMHYFKKMVMVNNTQLHEVMVM